LALGGLSPEAVEALKAREWPGNVRELEHALERALILSRGGRIAPDHLALPSETGSSSDLFGAVPAEMGLHEAVGELERELVQRALASVGGNRTRAAQLLKISRRLLYDKLQQYGIG
jgi:DNA-binding NtrC family response regulator